MLLLVLSTLYIMHILLRLLTATLSPLVIVTSASISPAFSPGNSLFVRNCDGEADINAGDIVVCRQGRNLPTIHRIVERRQAMTDSSSRLIVDRYVDVAAVIVRLS